MLFENPFFRREVRALRRRELAPADPFLIVQVAALWLPVLLQERLLWHEETNETFRRVLALLALVMVHAGCGVAAGVNLAARVLLEEHRRGTLDALRTIAVPSWLWLPQKLLMPLAGTVLVWLAGLPFYAALCMRGHFLPRELAPLFVLSGAAALLAFCGTLLLPPEGLRLRPRPGMYASRLDYLLDLARAGLSWGTAGVLLITTFHAGRYAGRVTDTPYPSLPFYSGWLETGTGLLTLLAAVVLAALAAAWEAADPASRPASFLSRALRLLAVGAAYYLLLGHVWAPLAEPVRVLALALFPAAVLLAAASGRRPAELVGRRERAEAGWLARGWDNPVFVRDLRVALRGGGLLRQACSRIGALVLGLLATGLLAAAGIGPRFAPPGPSWLGLLFQVGLMAFLAGFFVSIPALLGLGGRAINNWQAERQANTLPQLLTSPLPSDAVVKGRWAAALLVGAARNLPLVGTYVFGFTVLHLNGAMRGTDTMLCIALWLLSLGVLLSAGCASAFRQVIRLQDLGSATLLSVWLLLAEGAGLAFAINNQSLFTEDLGALIRGYCLLMAPLNAALTAFIYRRGVAGLEALRRAEIEA
jgi:hypothetical protein